MTDFATATACRCPPDRPATVWRTDLSVVTERLSSVSREDRSMLDSSSTTPASNPLPAQEHVGHDVEVVGEREILVDDLDAEPGGVAGAVDVDRLALVAHLALVERVDADDALDQRRLAGTVVADQSHDLTATNLEIDPVERLDGAEGLGDPPKLEERRVSGGHYVEGGEGAEAPSPTVRASSISCSLCRSPYRRCRRYRSPRSS